MGGCFPDLRCDQMFFPSRFHLTVQYVFVMILYGQKMLEFFRINRD